MAGKTVKTVTKRVSHHSLSKTSYYKYVAYNKFY